jgi:hypothetical protein
MEPGVLAGKDLFIIINDQAVHINVYSKNYNVAFGDPTYL